MFKNFCRHNAAVSDLYNSKSKIKIAVVFFPNSHGWLHHNVFSFINQLNVIDIVNKSSVSFFINTKVAKKNS